MVFGTLFMTCFHEFTIYETTKNFRNKEYFFFYSSCKVSLLVKLNSYSSFFFYLNKVSIEEFYKCFDRK